ncbi:3-coathanger stack domain-containing protein [Flavobacterium lindanitolerans]|uniref:3-coathanger stack domain-containing protein n=1 Tax=Flavobacterium lindanitolerans TaxID=428988 RepID=UPI0031CE1450
MKKLYILILFLTCGLKSFAQGTDVIFWIDNSGSIDDIEYAAMKASVSNIMANVLECNPDNKITVIQYAATKVGTNFIPKIKIETDFTNSAISFSRVPVADVGNYDFAHESLGLIGKALDHITDSNILGTSFLNRTSGNTLAIYFFTDALRDDLTGSCLVNKNTILIGSNGAFQNYTNFKVSRNATFIVTMVPSGAEGSMPGSDLKAKKAGAAISSGGNGGTYILNEIESYPLDPNGPGSLPRFFLYKPNFTLTAVEIGAISDQLCSVVQAPCPQHLILTSPLDDVNAPIQDNRQASISITASNQINKEAVGIYHAGSTLVFKSGFHSKNGSRFRAYVEGCSDKFVGRESDITNRKEFQKEMKGTQIVQKPLLYPNPATQKATIEYDEPIHNLLISSIDGRTIFSKILKTNSYEIDLSNYKNGIYIVTIQTSNGNIFTSKLIKE